MNFKTVFLFPFLFLFCSFSLQTFGQSDPGLTSGTTKLKIKDHPLDFTRELADRIEEKKEEFVQLLTQMDNFFGADYEVDFVVRTLRGFPDHESFYMKNIDPEAVKKVAVYAARNVPLYTLILQGLVPSLVARKVVIRTPERTRDLYDSLWKRIQDLMPEYDLSPLDLNSDNYRVFMNKHILAANSSQSNFLDDEDPADVVIFTGSPETGADIQEKIVEGLAKIDEKTREGNKNHQAKLTQLTEAIGALEKKKKEEGKLTSLEGNNLSKFKTQLAKEQKQKVRKEVEGFRLLFFKNGNGLNPAVVTDLSKDNMKAALLAPLKAIKMNSGQDCTSPKLYVVHQDVYPDYMEKLHDLVKNMKYGDLSDPTADFSQMTFIKEPERDKLLEFRKKYEAYLTNKETAEITTGKDGSIKITPHIFEFPFSLLKDIELKDHFAPFIIVIKYANLTELQTLAADPRAHQKAMFASIFGDSRNREIMKSLSLFQNSFANTLLNKDVYNGEGYLPYGGWGADSSTLTLVTFKDSQSTFTNKIRPLLFSKDCMECFPGKVMIPLELTHPSGEEIEKSRNHLQALLKKAVDHSPRNLQEIYGSAPPLRDPIVSLKIKRGLDHIQEQIKQRGLVIASDVIPPKNKGQREEMGDIDDLSPLFGAKVVLTRTLGKREKIPGVVLHSTVGGRENSSINTLSGEVNLSKGFGQLNQLLLDRVNEYHMAQAISPGIMAHASTYQDLPPEVQEKLNALREIIQKDKGKKGPDVRGPLAELVHLFMAAVKKKYPHGAFIKNYGESTTGDLGIQVTSFNYEVENMMDQYLSEMEKGRGKSVESLGLYATEARFLYKLIHDPKDIFVQERVNIDKTELGASMEFRVDFVHGTPIISKNRFSDEFYPVEEEAARQVMENFFQKAKKDFPQILYLNGGADVAKLKDGSWKIIEFNVGSSAGSVDPRIFPIEANKFLSRLTGKNTPFMEFLVNLTQRPLEQQREFLKSVKVERKSWEVNSVEKVSLAEYAKFLRDHHLEEFSKNPSKAKAQETLVLLQTLFEGVGSPINVEIPHLMRGAENYLQRF